MIKKRRRMKTLQELIDDGLPVGALVECTIEERYICEFPLFFTSTWQYNGECLACVSGDCNFFEIGDTVFESYSPSVFQPTTAYDSGIDPETLPIPEPFWTGWVVWDGYKFQPIDYGDNGSGLFEDEYHMQYIKSDCKPCLPPA